MDIIVIGAGIIGCAVAYELARRGASVQIVDDRQVGMGATQASAGVLAPYIEADERDSEFLDLTVRSLDLYDDFIAHVTRDGGMTVGYRRTGTLEVATTEERMAGLRRTAARLEHEVMLDLLDAAGARAEEPNLSDDVAGALLIRTHGFVVAPELTRALALGARRRGAQIVEKSRVSRIERRNGDLIVETGRGSLTAEGVVLAAGSWSGQIAIEGVTRAAPVRPVRGQLVQVAWDGPPLRRVTWGERCYLVPWSDGTLLIGATVEDAGFDERTTVAGVRDLLEAASELVPHAWTAGFSGARAGLRPASADSLPIVGPSRVVSRLVYATGHYRNGVLLAPLTAQLVADAMLDNKLDPVLEKIGPQRFGL